MTLSSRKGSFIMKSIPILIFCLIFLSGCGGDDNSPTSGGNFEASPGRHSITYEITGSIGDSFNTVRSEFINSNGSLQVWSVRLPFKHDVSRFDGDLVSLRGIYQSLRDRVVTVTIRVDGRIWKTNTETGKDINVVVQGTL